MTNQSVYRLRKEVIKCPARIRSVGSILDLRRMREIKNGEWTKIFSLTFRYNCGNILKD